MNRPGPLPPRRSVRTLRRGLWIAMSIVAALLMAFTVASAANFSTIVVAKATVYLVPQYTVSYVGLEADGKLAPEGVITVLLAVRVENPSTRTLRLQLIAYSGWMRDGPAEAGLNESRRIGDDVLLGSTSPAWFFRVFGESSEITREPIPAEGNRTFAFTFTMSADVDIGRFRAVRNITDFAVGQGGSAASVPWNHYLLVVLTIDGVPEATSPSAPAYLRNLRRIERETGVNIAR